MRTKDVVLVCVILIAIITGVALLSQESKPALASKPEPIIARPNKSLALTVAQKTYARIVNINENGIVDQGSAVRIGKNLLLTCYHVLSPGATAYHDHYPVEIKAVHQFYDLAIVETNQYLADEVPLAMTVELGEELFNFSNATGEDGFFKSYHVAKIAGSRIYFQEAAFPGESGSGLINTRGELVGIFHKQFGATLGPGIQMPTYARGTLFTGIAEFMKIIVNGK